MENENNKAGSVPGPDNINAPVPDTAKDVSGKSLLDPHSEKYLKESANIEDLPDEEEDQEAIDQMKQESDNNH